MKDIVLIYKNDLVEEFIKKDITFNYAILDNPTIKYRLVQKVL